MRTLALLAVGLAVLLSAIVWLVAAPHGGVVASEPSRPGAPAPERSPRVDGLREPVVVASPPVAASAAPSREESLRAAVRDLIAREFASTIYTELVADLEEGSFSFERLRTTLESLGASADELRAAFESAAVDDPSRPGLLIGMGWDPGLDDAGRSWLAAIGGDDRPMPGGVDFAKAAERVGATYALRFSGSEPHLVHVSERCLAVLERGGHLTSEGMVARDVGRIGLEGLREPAGPELAARIQDAARLPISADFTQAAWRALARVGGDEGWRACTAALHEGNAGPAIAGLGAIRDPDALAQLRAMIEEPWAAERRVFQTYVAPGASEGILSIGTPDALAYVEERLSIGDGLRGGGWRESMIEGVRRSRQPAVLGDLIALEHRAAGDEEVSRALASAIERARRRARIERLTERDREDLRASLRRCLETVPRGSPAHEQAAKLLELHGDERDRSELGSR